MRRFWPLFGSPQPRVVLLAGNFTIGAAGAITAQTGARISGATVTQTGSEDGRYGVALDTRYKRALAAGASMVGPDDAAFPTTTGSDPQTRLLAVDGFSVQFKRVDTQADADPASGTIGTWWAIVSTV
jgi:hypothetical protein